MPTYQNGNIKAAGNKFNIDGNIKIIMEWAWLNFDMIKVTQLQERVIASIFQTERINVLIYFKQ
ncbi:hypothetical protein CS542_00610 [Pedobacter sp. IW39]|nr:hypothetical protein CS542_00610 [Pedobacter sp. IW39]